MQSHDNAFQCNCSHIDSLGKSVQPSLELITILTFISTANQNGEQFVCMARSFPRLTTIGRVLMQFSSDRQTFAETRDNGKCPITICPSADVNVSDNYRLLSHQKIIINCFNILATQETPLNRSCQRSKPFSHEAIITSNCFLNDCLARNALFFNALIVRWLTTLWAWIFAFQII